MRDKFDVLAVEFRAFREDASFRLKALEDALKSGDGQKDLQVLKGEISSLKDEVSKMEKAAAAAKSSSGSSSGSKSKD